MSEIICAISTPPGMGAIAVIRLSGEGSIVLTDRVFTSPSGRNLTEASANTVHFGQIHAGEELLDEVLVTIFHAPHSFTGEESVEISCHNSDNTDHGLIELLLSD